MRIFIDEDVPRELSADFRAGGHEVVLLDPTLKTVSQLRDLVPAALAAIPIAPKHQVTPIRPAVARPPTT